MIELDGGQHYSETGQAKDRTRDDVLREMGMNYPAASSGVSKTTTGKTLRPKGRGIHPDGNKSSQVFR